MRGTKNIHIPVLCIITSPLQQSSKQILLILEKENSCPSSSSRREDISFLSEE